MRRVIEYVRVFVEDYPQTPKDRGPIARVWWAHMTAAGME